jgi:hypothetical protein
MKKDNTGFYISAEENKPEINIVISLEEYKELLIIKGKYEELKSNQSLNIPYIQTNKDIKQFPWTITTSSIPEEITKIYCNCDHNSKEE